MFVMSRTASHRKAIPARKRHAQKPPELTRDKLIEAAGHVFAERGYRAATIREICRRAGANVAAVNYTFGDKMGLYTEVLRHSVRAAQTAAMKAALDSSLSPEDTIRGVIRARLMSLCQEARPDWHIRLVMHEFSHPTPAMQRVVDEGMRPIYDRMRKRWAKSIGLPPDHETTRLSVNSIVGQILFYTFSRPVLMQFAAGIETHAGSIGSHRGPHRGFFAGIFEESGARQTSWSEMKTSTMTQSPPSAEQRRHRRARFGSATRKTKPPRSRVFKNCDRRGGNRRRIRDLENIFRHAKFAGQHRRAQRAH